MSLIVLSQINQEAFFVATAIVHIIISWKIASVLPKGIIGTLCFVGLLSLILFPINGINGLGNGLMATIQGCTESIPSIYQRMGEELLQIPSIIKSKSTKDITLHIFILGLIGSLSLAKLIAIKTYKMTELTIREARK